MRFWLKGDPAVPTAKHVTKRSDRKAPESSEPQIEQSAEPKTDATNNISRAAASL
jgi:hypothetical protein